MKRHIQVFCSLLTFVLIFMAMPPIVFAASESPQSEDIFLSDIELQQFEHCSADYSDVPVTLSSSLILDKTLSIAKYSSTQLYITGTTQCISSVKKCGFSKVTVQRRKNSSSSWSDYATYTELYSNSSGYQLGKLVTIKTGYQYRVKATHYAYESILSTQTISATTSYLSF